MSKSSPLVAARARLLQAALTYPESHEDHPWGEHVVKVRGKVFVFMGMPENHDWLSFTVKLPVSGPIALSLPFAQPCGYGLGKSGWVTARFPRGEDIPEPLLLEWLEESFRAVAPKKLVALRAGGTPPAPRGATKKPAAARKKPAAVTKKRAARKEPAAAKKKPAARKQKPAAGRRQAAR